MGEHVWAASRYGNREVARQSVQPPTGVIGLNSHGVLGSDGGHGLADAGPVPVVADHARGGKSAQNEAQIGLHGI
jgi:hypothetical protein